MKTWNIFFSILLMQAFILSPASANHSSKGYLSDRYPDEIFGDYTEWPPENITDSDVDILRNIVCVLETTRGEIRVEVYPDDAPLTSANFVKLIQDGFYDGLTFHRVVEGFVSQGGDPLGDGTGGPGWELPAEIGLPHQAGSAAMARTGDDVNPERRSSGSQFYFCHNRENTQHLDGRYTVFGQIVEGQDVNLSLIKTYIDKYTPADVEPDLILRAWIEYKEFFF